MPNLRSFLLIALAFTGFLLWQAWQTDYAPRPVASGATVGDAPVTAQDAPPASASASTADVPSAAAAPAATPSVAADVANTPAMSTPSAAAQRIVVQTDVLRVEIDPEGGSIVDAQLIAYRSSTKPDATPVTLLRHTGVEFYAAQSGLVANQAAAPDHRSLFDHERNEYRLQDGQNSVDVPLFWTDPNGVAVTKVFRFERGSYVIGLEQRIDNRGTTPWNGSAYTQLQRTKPSNAQGFSFTNPEQYSFVGAAWYSPDEHFEKLKFDDFKDEPLQREFAGGWAAMLQHYFFTAWIPPAEQQTAYATAVVGDTNAPRYLIRAMSPSSTVAPGAQTTFPSRLYVGPKLQETIGAIAPGLEYTVDYGLVTIFAQPLYWVMSKIHTLVGNWGWSIVLITVLLKLLMYPLSEAQFRSMAKMRAMQPRMQALKERYGEDRQKYNQAMMELYQKEKINPMGGCLPLLIQMPIFIALYWVLIESVELRHAPFVGWIQNLSDKDPYFILPLINAVTMIVTQRLSPTTGLDPMQQKLMQMMPIVFGVMFAFFPAGLVLYWAVNGLLSLAQQWVILRRVEGAKKPA